MTSNWLANFHLLRKSCEKKAKKNKGSSQECRQVFSLFQSQGRETRGALSSLTVQMFLLFLSSSSDPHHSRERFFFFFSLFQEKKRWGKKKKMMEMMMKIMRAGYQNTLLGLEIMHLCILLLPVSLSSSYAPVGFRRGSSSIIFYVFRWMMLSNLQTLRSSWIILPSSKLFFTSSFWTITWISLIHLQA